MVRTCFHVAWCLLVAPCTLSQNPRLEVHEGVDIVWSSPAHRKKPRAVLVLFHRAGRSGLSWWPASKSCPNCDGLPEESRITSSGSAAGFATAALSCVDSRSRRWSQRDGPMVAHSLVSLMSARKWRGLPLFVVGVGCGAGFVATVLPSALPPSVEIAGVHIQLMSDPAGLKPSVIAKAFKNGQGVVGAGWFGRAKAALNNPPSRTVAVMYVTRDATVARAAKAIYAAWQQAGANVLEQHVNPLPVKDLYFSNTIQSLRAVESAMLVAKLRKAKFLSLDGFLLEDPMTSEWRSVVSAPIGSSGAFELGVLRSVVQEAHRSPLRSPIGEAINRAFAFSEVSGHAINDTLAFFVAALKQQIPVGEPSPS
mmetsp:Transcript_18472/g.59573  ORF Transcript_18472/g.59573 Transcript_18472/m.59573 type:complete len:367 (+) Transcript_18472:145-1245(+)